MSQLTETIGLLYRMETADIQALSNTLLEVRKQAWRDALNEQARAYGCNKVPNDPRLSDLAELKDLSLADARSIADTWNKEVMAQIEKLYNDNVRGNRFYYTSNLERWASARASWKDAQVALNTEQTTRFFAQNRFREENDLKGKTLYIFVGPPPVCKICARMFGAGLVDETFIRRNPAPVHIGCPHEWEAMSKQPIACADMWVG